MAKSKDGVIGIFSSDPNISWLVNQLGKTENHPVEILHQLKNLGRLSLIVIDLDNLQTGEEASLTVQNIHREYPEVRVFALTSISGLSDMLCEEGVEHVFLKPVLLEHLYNSILSAVKNIRTSSSREIKASRSSSPRAKIFIIDDELEVCEFLRDALEDSEEGEFEVQYAQDPQRAIRACAEFEPDLVIVDLKLPQMSGIELIERFKRFSGFKPKDFLIFTGSDNAESIKHLKSLGFSCLPKYCDLSEIIDAIVSMCRKWKLVSKVA